MKKNYINQKCFSFILFIAISALNALVANGTNSDNYWSYTTGNYNSDGKPDLYCIRTNNTQSGYTEIQVLSGITNYQTNLFKGATALGITNNWQWFFLAADFNNDQKVDLYCIKKNDTGSGKTEIHILNGADNFQTFLTHISSTLNSTDENWEFALGDYNADSKIDIYCIAKSYNGSGKTEVHVLNGADNFQTYLLHTATPQNSTDASWTFKLGDYNKDGKLDLFGLQRNFTGTNVTEVHVLNGASNFQDFIFHSGTSFPMKNNDQSEFALADFNNDSNIDLIAISKYGNQTNNKEIFVYAGQDFKNNLLSTSTSIPEEEETNLTNAPAPISYNWEATDAVGRKLPDYSLAGSTKNKKVGLFYWTWGYNFSNNKPMVITDFISKNPSAINNFNDPIWPNLGAWWWSEPLFGFYTSTDKWVLRKHGEMLADAGVDFVLFDCTNGAYTWKPAYMALCETWAEARKQGVRTPQIGFMLGFGASADALTALKEIYNDLYKNSLYKDLWFYHKGKPLVMGYPDLLKDVPGNLTESNLNREILNFFTFRPGMPTYFDAPSRNDQWGWLQVYPQHGFVKNANGKYEQVTVGVSQNANDNGISAMNAPNTYGRSYTKAKGQNNNTDAHNYGYNFEEQWSKAYELDPELVFITGWNEWFAGRFERWPGTPDAPINAFPDEFSPEKSRDIEPMKGGHGDNYYYQMASNIRKFKGMNAPGLLSGPILSAKIDGIFSDWTSVTPEYKHHMGSTPQRNSAGWNGTYYTNTTGRNDFILSKVTRDASSLYFYMQTAMDITPAGANWMTLFIDIDRNKSTGWEGYDYVINRLAPDVNQAIVEKSTGGWNWTFVGKADFSFKNNQLEIKLPKALIGISNIADLNFEFKWSDNMQNQGDINDFTVNGDAAPSGRFNYLYKGSTPKPYNNSITIIPGKVEAENYDAGANGTAYFDTDPGNNGGLLRNDDVDVQKVPASNYGIGWIVPGEWLTYTLDIQQSGYYDISLNLASIVSDAKMHIEIGGDNITGSIGIPNTGSYDTYTLKNINKIYLKSGITTMRMYFETGGFNIDYVDYRLSFITSNTESDLQKDIFIYPNPTSKQINIALSETIAIEKVALFSQEGKALFIKPIFDAKNITIPLDQSFHEGILLLELTTSKGVFYKKIVKIN